MDCYGFVEMVELKIIGEEEDGSMDVLYLVYIGFSGALHCIACAKYVVGSGESVAPNAVMPRW